MAESKTSCKSRPKIVGMEVHYQIKLIGEAKTWRQSSKDKVVLCYKVFIHSLSGDPESVLSSDELKELTF